MGGWLNSVLNGLRKWCGAWLNRQIVCLHGLLEVLIDRLEPRKFFCSIWMSKQYFDDCLKFCSIVEIT